MYKCKHFKIEELVPEDVFEEYGEELCWQLFDEQALMMLDGIREYFGLPVTVNNWHKGGFFHNRGYRRPDTAIGAKGSMHKLGKAFDSDVKGLTAEEVRKKILSDKDCELLKYINRIEASVSWLHCDVKPVQERIMVFVP